MNNIEMNALLKILSKMDKKDLESGIAKAQEILRNKDANTILKDITPNNK